MKTLVSDTEFADWIEGKIEFKHFMNYPLIEQRRQRCEKNAARQQALVAAIASGTTVHEFRRENINRKKRERYHSSLGAKMRVYLSTMVNTRLRKQRGRVGKSAKTELLLGCTVEDFMGYIESKWMPGMSWENWGARRNSWHLDHIRPCASFDLSLAEEQRECFHFTNYQPLWARENIRKGANYHVA